jgi:putative transposase
MEQAIGTSAACRVLGKSRATLHRQRNPKPAAPPAGRKEFRHPAELSPEEKQSVLAVLDSPRFADKAVAQAYTILLDEGCYLCSQATMHRLLRERGTSGERRAQAAHPAKKKPELLAAGPDEVWSWDITKLKGPARGIWYLLYVILDIYSRKVIHWEIWPTETGTLAKEFIEHAIAVNGGIKPRAVHADRGTSMTSDTVAGLYAKLNIAQSHSRPRVSDDNPYSEAQFKTLKYCPAFPGEFGSIQDANVFCWRPTGFVDNYIMPLAPFSCQFRVHTRRASDTPVPSESSDDCSTLPRTRTKPASHARRSSMHAGG